RVIKQVEAVEILLLSSRQIGRIVKRIKIEGDKGIIHKSRGKPSNRRIPGEIRDRVIKLYRTQYQDFGPTLASEKLLEREGIGINDETLRWWLIETTSKDR
ncbi:MAG: helix-turn-helix domain-containing protein, partial [Deltaproteobacteria bacterium]